MPCTRSGNAIICSRGSRRPPRCIYCGTPSSHLCDFPVEREGKTTTCDAALCRRCSTRIPGARDLCRSHSALWDHATGRPKVGPSAAGPVPAGGAA
jgi:hypothetical protein